MEKYRNIGGGSGVFAYENGAEYIKVKFSETNKIYTYSYQKAGENHVKNMKKLAIDGRGLNSYINKYVKKLYD
jgi:hypothetical protein